MLEAQDFAPLFCVVNIFWGGWVIIYLSYIYYIFIVYLSYIYSIFIICYSIGVGWGLCWFS